MVSESDLIVNPNEKSAIFKYYPDLKELNKVTLLNLSHGQMQQDIFAYLESGRKEKGFFVEFGATDGFSMSNTYMLEQEFQWRGILAEPAKMWTEQLKENRPNAMIETLCVWEETGAQLDFLEAEIGGLSTIENYVDHDANAARRTPRLKYTVNTISLFDLLEKHQAPEEIDYLSIDTEGSEFKILSSFLEDNANQNNKYKIRLITCEHNFTENREKIYQLLTKNGYIRKYNDVSWVDDWYVLNSSF
jgi:FkbM family methyltransferase